MCAIPESIRILRRRRLHNDQTSSGLHTGGQAGMWRSSLGKRNNRIYLVLIDIKFMYFSCFVWMIFGVFGPRAGVSQGWAGGCGRNGRKFSARMFCAA